MTDNCAKAIARKIFSKNTQAFLFPQKYASQNRIRFPWEDESLISPKEITFFQKRQLLFGRKCKFETFIIQRFYAKETPPSYKALRGQN